MGSHQFLPLLTALVGEFRAILRARLQVLASCDLARQELTFLTVLPRLVLS